MVTHEQIVDRLKHLGYTYTDEDYDAVEFELNKTINYVINNFTRSTVPDILDPRIIDRVCADFLFYKKNSGSLKGFNYDAVIKQIKEGDTTIQYAVGQGEDTPENRFDTFVKSLERGFDKWCVPHRRLLW
jgi:hypothetical protein